MCLVAIAVGVDPEFPLVLVGNRDEFHSRPSVPMHWWRSPRLLAGRDLEAGGTWLALTRGGHLATVTNFREPDTVPGTRSRGALVVRSLSDETRPFVEHLEEAGAEYGGFNLLWWDGRALRYHSNRVAAGIRTLPAGVYGLSNGVLDAQWPKLVRCREALRGLLSGGRITVEECFAILRDRHVPADGDLPRTGITHDWERLLSTAFIISPRYGTRAASVVMMRRDGTVCVQERGYDPQGHETTRRSFRFVRTGAAVAS